MAQNPRISLIAAIGKNRELGKDGELLWRIPDDLKRFKKLTSGHPVVMGRKTWESLPEKFRPLPGRTNIVITRQPEYQASGATVTNSIQNAFASAAGAAGAEEVFVIGGAEIYAQALPFASRLYLTIIDDAKDADVFFPQYEGSFGKVLSEEAGLHGGVSYRWVDLERD